MKIISRFIIALLICFASILNFSGCSFCGFAIGSIVDTYNGETLPPSAIIASHKGDNIKIETTSGDRYKGKFTTIDTNWTQDYSAEYEAARMKLAERDTLIPALGELLEFSNNHNDQLMTVVFLGFDYGVSIWIEPQDSSITRTWPLSNVSSLHNKAGRVYDIETLRLLLNHKRIPVRISFTMNMARKTVTLPMSEVTQVEKDDYKYGKFIGLGVGLVIDIAIISALSSWRHTTECW
jgi:hypothetical protein